MIHSELFEGNHKIKQQSISSSRCLLGGWAVSQWLFQNLHVMMFLPKPIV